jgi:hypothetical protein
MPNGVSPSPPPILNWPDDEIRPPIRLTSSNWHLACRIATHHPSAAPALVAVLVGLRGPFLFWKGPVIDGAAGVLRAIHSHLPASPGLKPGT